MNLPNAITVGRIALTPLIAWLPFVSSPSARLFAFLLFLTAAITDYWDGHLARQRNLVTDLGRILDPLADKLLLVGTIVPMFLLQRSADFISPLDRLLSESGTTAPFLFITPIGRVSLPLWMLLLVLGRELFMTVFRQVAVRRGLVISAIGPAKWKTMFQLLWVGAAYFWFFAKTVATTEGWTSLGWWEAFAMFNGVVGVTAMTGAVVLTFFSLVLYLRRYGARVVSSHAH